MLGKTPLHFDRRSFFFMNGRAKALMVLVVAVQIAAIFLDLVSVSAIPLLIELAVKPERLLGQKMAVDLFHAVGVFEPLAMVTLLGIILIGFIVFTAVIKMLAIQASLTFARNYEIRVFTDIMNVVAKLHPAYLALKGIVSFRQSLRPELKFATNGYLIPLMDFATKSIVTVAAIATLAAVDTVLVLLIGAGFALMYSLVYVARKQWITGLGYRNRATYARGTTQTVGLLVALHSRVFVKPFKEALDEVLSLQRDYSKTQLRISVFNQLPRIVFESFAIAVLLVLILVTIQTGSADRFTSIASMFVIAFFRLSAIFQGAFVSFSRARMNQQYYKNIKESYPAYQAEATNPTVTSDGSIRVDHSLSLADANVIEVPGEDPIELPDFQVTPGEVVVLQSELASLSSLLARAFTGQLALKTGTFKLDGEVSGIAFLTTAHITAYVGNYPPFLSQRALKEHLFPNYEPSSEEMSRANRILEDFRTQGAKLPGLESHEILTLGKNDGENRRLRFRLGLFRVLLSKSPIVVVDGIDAAVSGLEATTLWSLIQKHAPEKTLVFAGGLGDVPAFVTRVFDVDGAVASIDPNQRAEARAAAQLGYTDQDDGTEDE